MQAVTGDCLRAYEMPEAGVLSGVRLLVVEDNFFVAEPMCSILASVGGICVGPAGTLERALRLASEELTHGAFLDINLNGVYSFPVARLLRGKGVPLAFVSGHTGLIVPADLRDLPLIAKPFEPHEVVAAAVCFAGMRF